MWREGGGPRKRPAIGIFMMSAREKRASPDWNHCGGVCGWDFHALQRVTTCTETRTRTAEMSGLESMYLQVEDVWVGRAIRGVLASPCFLGLEY